MKQLTCEMCGSTDLMKQDGVFVCQSCGCKYSVEDAKRMMIEGSVDVSGSTVKVDNSAFVQKYLENARRAKEKTDWEETEKYYNMVEQNAPQNIEAVFYSAYAKARRSLSDADYHKKKQALVILRKSISVIDDYYNPAQQAALRPLIETMGRDMLELPETEFVYHANDEVIIDGKKYSERAVVKLIFKAVQLEFVKTLENIIKKDEQIYLYHLLISFYECVIGYDVFPDTGTSTMQENLRNDYKTRLSMVNTRVKELDPTYEPKPLPEKKEQGGGCYVATAVYGSYDCPQVLPKLGMAEHSSAPIMQSAPPLLSGLDIPSGSRICGRASSTAWLPI